MAIATGTALAIGGLAAAGGGVASGIIGANAADSAANKQLAAQQESARLQYQANKDSIAAQRDASLRAESFLREQAGIARQDLAPLVQAQTKAVSDLQGLTDPNSTLYQQQRSVNTEAIQRQLAAQGLLRSKSQTDLLSNLELGLNQQRVGILGGLSGLGAIQGQSNLSGNLGTSLAGVQGNLGAGLASGFQNLGNQLSAGAINTGNSLANLGIAKANAITGGLSGFNNAFQSTLGSYAQQDFLSSLLKAKGQ